MCRLFIPLLILLLFLATSCDREEEDFIKKPTATSTVITGTINTPDGTPLGNIPVCVDFEFRSFISGTLVKHKAKGVTDKNGRYNIFFEIGEDKVTDLQRRYTFSVDLSGLSPENYLIPSPKLGFYLSAEDREGKTLNCDFTIPRKKYVKVSVENYGLPLEEGTYAVKNTFPYGAGWSALGQWNNDDPCELYVFEPIEIPQEGSRSVMLPCGIGIVNTVQAIYKGNDEVQYLIGLPSSDTKEILVTDDCDEELKLEYMTPEI